MIWAVSLLIPRPSAMSLYEKKRALIQAPQIFQKKATLPHKESASSSLSYTSSSIYAKWSSHAFVSCEKDISPQLSCFTVGSPPTPCCYSLSTKQNSSSTIW